MYFCIMKGMRHNKLFIKALLLFVFVFAFSIAEAQCSICTRTAQQMGEKPAKGINAGILYLAFAPLAIVGFIGFKWWKRNGVQD
jgi:hypothetical protein